MSRMTQAALFPVGSNSMAGTIKELMPYKDVALNYWGSNDLHNLRAIELDLLGRKRSSRQR